MSERAIIPERVCKTCGGAEWRVYTRVSPKRKNKSLVYNCVHCANKSTEKWRNANREHTREIVRIYRKEHLEKVRNYANEYQRKLRETPEGKSKIYAAIKKNARKASRILSNSYIKRVIYNVVLHNTGEKIKACDITQEQVERYRESILAYRKLKEVNKQLKSEKVMKTKTPELTKERMSVGMKQSWERRKAEKLTDSTVTLLEKESVTGASGLTRSEQMKKNWEKRREKAANTSPAIVSPSLGAIETLLNDLKVLATKKQQILHHLDSIKQLINQL